MFLAPSRILILALLPACGGGAEPAQPGAGAPASSLSDTLAAEAAQALGRSDRAAMEALLAQVESHLEAAPSDPAARALAGRLAEALVDHETALAHYLALDLAQDGELSLRRGALQLDAGELAEAKADLLRAQSLGEDGAELHYLLGRVAEEAGDSKAAQAAYVRSLERAPARPQVHFRLAQLLEERGDSENAARAMAEFQRWTGMHQLAQRASKAARGERDAGLAVAASRAWFAAGEFEFAASWARNAQSVEPDQAEAALMLCLVDQVRGEVAAAAKGLDALIARSPSFAEAHRERAWTHHAAGDPAAAEACMARALELAPLDARNLYEAGLLLLQIGKPDEALVRFEAAIANDPESVDAHLGAAQVRYSQQEWSLARKHWERVLELAPGHPGAEQSLAVLSEQGQ